MSVSVVCSCLFTREMAAIRNDKCIHANYFLHSTSISVTGTTCHAFV